MNYIDTFERVEHKYLLSKSQANKLYSYIRDYIQDDIYPQYSLHNIYLDSSNYTMISRSIEGPQYKEKLRIRSYGDPDDSGFIYVEMKKKYAGIVYKRRIQIKENELNDFFNGSLKIDNQILHEIEYMEQIYHPQPKIFIGYDRRAFSGKYENDVRITFDTNIRYRLDHLSLHDDYPDTYLLHDDQCLLEVKVMDRYPLWLTHALTSMHLTRTSFSKYGTIYTNILREERNSLYV